MTILIPVRPILLALALTTLVPAAAAEPMALVFNCSAMRLPDQQLVSRAFGTANFGQTYAARARAMQIAQRACLHRANDSRMLASDVGISTVQIPHDPD